MSCCPFKQRLCTQGVCTCPVCGRWCIALVLLLLLLLLPCVGTTSCVKCMCPRVQALRSPTPLLHAPRPPPMRRRRAAGGEVAAGGSMHVRSRVRLQIHIQGPIHTRQLACPCTQARTLHRAWSGLNGAPTKAPMRRALLHGMQSCASPPRLGWGCPSNTSRGGHTTSALLHRNCGHYTPTPSTGLLPDPVVCLGRRGPPPTYTHTQP